MEKKLRFILLLGGLLMVTLPGQSQDFDKPHPDRSPATIDDQKPVAENAAEGEAMLEPSVTNELEVAEPGPVMIPDRRLRRRHEVNEGTIISALCDLSPAPLPVMSRQNPGPVYATDYFIRRDLAEAVSTPSQPATTDADEASTATVQPAIQAMRVLRYDPDPGGDLQRRLENCPRLRDNLVWQTPTGDNIPFPQWTPEQKGRLNMFFQRLLQGAEDLGIRCADKDRAMWGEHRALYFDHEEAFDTYAAHAAHVLYLEAENLVPWKVVRRPPDEIQQLLASENYFSPIRPVAVVPGGGYPSHIVPGEDFQPIGWAQYKGIMLCDPRDGFRALHSELSSWQQLQEDMLGGTEEETLANLTVWMRDWVRHLSQSFSSAPDGLAYEHLTLRERLSAREHDSYRGILAFQGCHSAAHTLRDLARSFNIPLLVGASQDSPDMDIVPFPSRTHLGLCWRWKSRDARCLWHVDNIYASPGREPSFPIDAANDPLTGQEANTNYFRSHWVPKDDLPKWGFTLLMDKLVPSDSGIGYSILYPNDDYYDYGWFLGYWERSDREQAEHQLGNTGLDNPYLSDLSEYFSLHSLYRAGAYGILEDICFSVYGIQNQVNDLAQNGGRAGLVRPGTYTGSQFRENALEIVEAYGDTLSNCANIELTRTEWVSRRNFENP